MVCTVLPDTSKKLEISVLVDVFVTLTIVILENSDGRTSVKVKSNASVSLVTSLLSISIV